ncbi:hypothetical protein [Bradyrhizobium sp. CCBAU 45389]|uniref:hypothetical protein n=1 Tax=Bradyrhizobium sp. CCBAU 45389 TaxID=858429 RepID=UPI002305EA44|nr:hypothetical protein [Bradyrhizobium sp. CCBAU 45389]MDA9399831.1 hypothetical protein [Bradyrhizobium sp. CCBAU 45389]
MSTGPWRARPREITRTVKSVQSTGLHVRNVEVTRDGTIRVNIGKPNEAGDADNTNQEPDEWD